MSNSLGNYGQLIAAQVKQLPDPVAFERDREVEQVLGQFDAPRPSFLLVGPAGCGKTTILFEVFKRLLKQPGKEWTLLTTSTSELLRDTRYIGEWQTRVINFAEAMLNQRHSAALCTDIISFPATGKWSQSDENMAIVLKPYLEKGLFLIGECDEQQYAANIQSNPWFDNCFTVIRIEPSDEAACRRIVEAVFRRSVAALEPVPDSQSIACDNDTIDAIKEYGQLYFPAITPPAGAIKLIEQVTRSLAQRIEESAADEHGYANSHELVCGRADVVASVSALTGLPTLLFDDSESLDLLKTREYFETRVIGQPAAISTIINLITLIKAGLSDPGKPMGVLFFVGPTGVGKTELAKTLAEFIFGSADRLIRFDMSEFKDYHAFEKLIGDSSTADNKRAQGHLLERVRNQPFSVILLDEIEKAHPNMFDLLLQLFDDGRLSDARGNSVNFTQTIVILTSNLGSQHGSRTPIGFSGSVEDAAGQNDTQIQEAMSRVFRPELINRIDHIVKFQPLDREHVQLIAQRELGQVLLRGGITRRQLQVDVQPGVIDIIAEEGFHPEYGARPLKRAVERLALMPIARKLVGMKPNRGPALLRLLPAGDKIALKVVYDRPSKYSGSRPAATVEIVDPVDGTRRKQSATDVARIIERLSSVVDFLVDESQNQGLAEQRSRIVGRTGAVDFWDNPAVARQDLSRLYQLERTLEGIEQLRASARSLPADLTRVRKNNDVRALERIADQSAQLLNQGEILNYVISCQDVQDRCDVFVVFHETGPADDGPIDKLIDCYQNWARRKGFEARLIHEQEDAESRESVLLVEGVAVYGMLKNESGIHEFVWEKTADSARRVSWVAVRVMPVLDEPAGWSPVVEVQRARNKGRRISQHRTVTTATDKSSGVNVRLTGDLSAAEMDPIATDFLAAEVRFRRSPDGDGNEKPVRRYVMHPAQSARDLRTGVTQHNLKKLWSGKIDEFLLSFIESPLNST